MHIKKEERGKFIALSGVRTMTLGIVYQQLLDWEKDGMMLLTNIHLLPIEKDFLDLASYAHFLQKGPCREDPQFSQTFPFSRAMKDFAKFLYREQRGEVSASDLEDVRESINQYLTNGHDRLCKQKIVKAIRHFFENREMFSGNDYSFPGWELLWLCAFSVESYQSNVNPFLERGINVFGYLPLDSFHWELSCGGNPTMIQFFCEISTALKEWLGIKQLFLDDIKMFLDIPEEEAFDHVKMLLPCNGKTSPEEFSKLLKGLREKVTHGDHFITNGDQGHLRIANDIFNTLSCFSEANPLEVMVES